MAVQRYDHNSLGAVGYLTRNSPTVGEALRCLQLHLHLNDHGAALFLLWLDSDRVALCYSIFRHDTPAISMIYDAALAIAYGVLRELCGPSWKPLAVQFAHRRPEATRPYREFFGTRPEFDADRSAIVFKASWLDHRIAGADPALHASLAEDRPPAGGQRARQSGFAGATRLASDGIQQNRNTRPNLEALFAPRADLAATARGRRHHVSPAPQRSEIRGGAAAPVRNAAACGRNRGDPGIFESRYVLASFPQLVRNAAQAMARASA